MPAPFTLVQATWIKRATADEKRTMATLVDEMNRDEEYGTVWTLTHQSSWCAIGRNAELYGDNEVANIFYRCACGAVDFTPAESDLDDLYCYDCHSHVEIRDTNY